LTGANADFPARGHFGRSEAVPVGQEHQRESAQSPFVFVSERGAPLSAPGFSRTENVYLLRSIAISATAVSGAFLAVQQAPPKTIALIV
jgi:hypothetical protein